MKTYKNIFEGMISPEHLFGAWDRFKQEKRKKSDVMEFEKNLEQHIFQLHRDLRNRAYKHGAYTGFYISDPKLRHIHKATVRDRVLHHAIFIVLNPAFEHGFINVYMNDLDQFIKQELCLKHYVRYADDFVIVANDRTELEKLIAPIEQFLQEKLRLELHPDKIQLVKYRKGVDFLGYVQFPHHRLMRRESKQRMLRKLRHAEMYYQRGELDEARMHATLQSYLGVLSHADAHRLSELLKNKYWMLEPQKTGAMRERERERE